MKKIRVAINGFGRIGRLVLRAAVESGRRDIEFVAVNDLMPADQSAFLLEHDSVHGAFPATVKIAEVPRSGRGMTVLSVGGHKIKVLSERDPAALPWRELGVDVVMECTGIFTSADAARAHIAAGAKRVLVSAPSRGADRAIVIGVNDRALKKSDKIVSCGSCTTNALAPVAAVLDEKFGIIDGWMTTVHSYTGDQQLLDKNHRDFRRARAAAMSIIPTTTGAALAIGDVLPRLSGKLNGIALRVPTPDVSVVEFVVNLKKRATADEINAALTAAAKGAMKNILGIESRPLVSVDFIHDARSSIVDTALTHTIGGMAHVTTWYDNEWGFSNRMCDLASKMG
ncbi:MAG: type I glyceraldehyde-3-phosphate dehydrogenase [Rickettsiales bacterium]|jgi:glyceraldehyde 3-phosphate dehydrogenase|nr:type I glyceraldehyde-3-phosphate dehydrogenase [Rickettsiales bacterium]